MIARDAQRRGMSTDDPSAIKQTALDHIEGFHDGDAWPPFHRLLVITIT